MDCREVIARLSEFLDQELVEDDRDRIELHIVDCSNCRVYVETVRKTIALYRCETELDCPEQVRVRLQTILAIEYRKK